MSMRVGMWVMRCGVACRSATGATSKSTASTILSVQQAGYRGDACCSDMMLCCGVLEVLRCDVLTCIGLFCALNFNKFCVAVCWRGDR